MHHDTVANWYRARGLAVPPEQYLSESGFICGTAAAWLFPTGTPVYFVDGLISDPAADRTGSVEAVCAACYSAAKQERPDAVVLLLTRHASVVRKLGWESLGNNFSLLVKH